MKKNLLLFCLSLALAGTIASCGGGGGGSTNTAQTVSDYNPNFLFGSPTGGIVRFYSGTQLIATYRYETAFIDGNTSIASSVYPAVYAAGVHRSFLNPCVFVETVTNGQHTFTVQNEALTTEGTRELAGTGYGPEATIVFPRNGTTLTYSGDASEGMKHIDEGEVVLYTYTADVLPGDVDGPDGDVPPTTNVGNFMQMRATYVRVDPK